MEDGESVLRFGLYVPNFGKASDAKSYAELALTAEQAGWDGFFLWDHLLEWDKPIPVTDSFIALAAIAAKTSRIRIGTTVTPLPKLPPWIAARQVAALDLLSDGRMTLGVGLGEVESTDYERFGGDSNKRVLAEKLDESLEIITSLWKGTACNYSGKHYRITKKTAFLPSPKQKPRVPIWVGGFWPNRGPFRRAAKWDGVIPLRRGHPIRPTPKDLGDILDFIKQQRTSSTHFDTVIIGWGTGKDKAVNAKKIGPYAKAGLTWWLESLYSGHDSLEKMRRRILMGPPSF